MYCSRCGTQMADAAAFCGNCGQPVMGPTIHAPAPAAAPPIGASPTAPPQLASGWPAPPVAGTQVYVPVPSPFAGFWLRLVAHIIDGLLLLIGFGVLAAVVVAIVGIGYFENAFENGESADVFLPFALVATILAAVLSLVVGCWVYYAWMESSEYQGTLGKMALGLIVTDLQGRRVTFGRATGRFFAKFITGLIPFYIGYIMAGFTEKKQALHDMIASCLVLRKS